MPSHAKSLVIGMGAASADAVVIVGAGRAPKLGVLADGVSSSEVCAALARASIRRLSSIASAGGRREKVSSGIGGAVPVVRAASISLIAADESPCAAEGSIVLGLDTIVAGMLAKMLCLIAEESPNILGRDAAGPPNSVDPEGGGAVVELLEPNRLVVCPVELDLNRPVEGAGALELELNKPVEGAGAVEPAPNRLVVGAVELGPDKLVEGALEAGPNKLVDGACVEG